MKCNFLALRLKNFLCFSKVFPEKFLIFFPKNTCSEKCLIFSQKKAFLIFRETKLSHIFLRKYFFISRYFAKWNFPAVRFQNFSRELPKFQKKKKRKENTRNRTFLLPKT